MKLNAQELRTADEHSLSEKKADLVRRPLYLILENVYDTYNIGGLYRLADALAVSTLFLCGETTTPPNNRIAKASVGTYKIVPWEYREDTVGLIRELQEHEIQVVAVEQSDRSVPYTSVSYSSPVALVVGNETFGVLPETVAACDAAVEIPMWGVNKSLNVIVSAAIVSYWVNKWMAGSARGITTSV